MEQKIKDRLLDEVVRLAKSREEEYDKVIYTLENIGANKESIELANQVKNGFFVLGDTKFIENPEITPEQYLDFVIKIHKILTENYLHLLNLQKGVRVVERNDVPDFPSFVKDIISNKKPTIVFSVKVTKTKISVDNGKDCWSFANNNRSGNKVYDILVSSKIDGMGYELLHHGREVLKTRDYNEFIQKIVSFFDM